MKNIDEYSDLGGENEAIREEDIEKSRALRRENEGMTKNKNETEEKINLLALRCTKYLRYQVATADLQGVQTIN